MNTDGVKKQNFVITCGKAERDYTIRKILPKAERLAAMQVTVRTMNN